MLLRLRAWIMRNRRAISVACAILVALLGFFALDRLVHEVKPGAVRAAFHGLTQGQMLSSIVLTALSYLALTFYDLIALRIIGRPLPWRTAALASFASYTLSHNFGLALFTGGSARYRVYRAHGLSAGDVGSIIVLASASLWSGVALLAGIGLVLNPAATALQISPAGQSFLGGALAAMGLAPVGLRLFGLRRLQLFGWELPLPDPARGAAMTGIATIDLAAASAALFVLLPYASLDTYPLFFLGYALAIAAAMVSHVPGGIGVFEAVMIATVPVDRIDLLAALIAYRIIYYVCPLIVAGLLIAWHEGRQWRHPLARIVSGGRSVARGLAPMALSALVFVGGVILLVSGSLPALPVRLGLLHDFVPLPFSEASHIAASLAGTLLLFLAPGLWQRLDGAFLATRTVLLAGMTFSLMKGLDYEEAIVLGAIAIALQWARSAFYRKTSLTAEPLSPQWLLAALTAIAASIFIGLFAFKHVAYRDALWWQFEARADASRFLRASLAVAVAVAGLALWRLFAPARATRRQAPLPDAVFASSLAHADRTEAYLAWTGDKQFIAAPEGDAFLMYRVRGSNWIAMGDPVGNRARWADLLWSLRERADAAQGRVTLYQISAETLPIAIDLGLSIVKYGEEARVELSRFSMDGHAAKPFRYAERRMKADGAHFEILSPEQVVAELGALRAVSDEWLATKGVAEKSFSLGRFDPAYLRRFPCAVVRQGERILAFANILTTPNGNELSVDLMRHTAQLPYGTMDFLFIQLIQWGRAEGYRWFTLGTAPLAGLDGRRLAPLWAKAGAFLFRNGEGLYGFEGLRAYKDKFATHWEPRYIAGPGGLRLAHALADLYGLISARAKPALLSA